MAISSGERGTKSQQQDRRNASDRDRAASDRGGRGGLGLSGARGTLSQQQDRVNRANASRAGNVAPGVGMGSATDSRARNSRYNQNLIASGPMTAHNMMELSKMMPGPGMALRAGLGIAGSPLGPQFEGVTPRSATGYSYDGPNRLGLQGRQALNLAGAFQPPKPPQPVKPMAPIMRPPSMAPGMQMGSGLQGYGAFRPGYSFFGPGSMR